MRRAFDRHITEPRSTTMKNKLALKSETLRRLDDDALDAIKGGAGNNNGNTAGNGNTNGTNNGTGDGQGNKTSCWIGNCCNGK
jgi:hypothetical protein